MSGDELRQAAATLRERAEASSTPIAPGAFDAFTGSGDRDVLLEVSVDEETQTWDFLPEVRYIATVHPGVGLALADWLDDEAVPRSTAGRSVPASEPAVRLARLINGGAA